MAYYNHNQRKIYYEVRGEGTPLLMIAGLSSDSQSWLPVLIPLSGKFKLITVDNRGVGRSDKDNKGLSITDLSEDIAGLIKFLGYEKVNILGHSMGGMIAMELAVKHPELIDNLILAATSVKAGNRNKMLFDSWITMMKGDMDKEFWFRNIYYWLFTPEFFEDEKLVEQAIKMSMNYRYLQSDESFKNQIDTIVKFDFTENVSKIKSRTLILYGENDILFNKDCTDNISYIPGSNTIIIKNAAHSIHFDNPKAFIKEVVNFLG